MHAPLIRAGAGIVTAVMLLLLALPLTASAATAAKVYNREEAWFLAKKEVLAEPTGEDPTCELPTGCNLSGSGQRPSPHPEGVLVVASNAGDPDAQMYFNFDTSGLPFGSIITGGTVTLPTAKDPEARQVNEANAKMVACLVTGFVPAGTDAGSYRDRPTFDDKVCEPVKQSKPAPDLTYTVDLTRFGKEWASGTMMNGITLMQDPAISPPAPQETWRVAFNSLRRSEQQTEAQKANPEESRIAYPPIVSTLDYKVEKFGGFPPPTGGGTGGFPPPETDTGSDSGGFDDGGFDTGGSTVTDSGGFDTGGASAPVDSGGFSAPGSSVPPPVDTPVAAEPPLAVGEPVAAPPVVPAAAVGPSMAVWMAPLIALIMAAAMAWSLLQPVELAGAREGAVSRLMRTRRLNAAEPS